MTIDVYDPINRISPNGILEYSVVTARTAEMLADFVNHMIKDGWHTQGGVSFHAPDNLHDHRSQYAQAMERWREVTT